MVASVAASVFPSSFFHINQGGSMEELQEVFPGCITEGDEVLVSCDDECVGGTASKSNMQATN